MGPLQGGCLCGAVRYEAEGEPFWALACHCRDCQHVTGGAAANIVMMQKSAVTVVTGQPREWAKQADSGRRITRSFCGACGTPLFISLEALPDALGMMVGSFDNPTFFRAKAELWLSSAPPWHRPEPDVPHFEKGPVHAK